MISPEINQINNFRLFKNGLIKKKSTIDECINSLTGIQSQILTASYISIFNRVDNINLTDIKDALWNKKKIVRTWGQRDTLHIYDMPTWNIIVSSMCEDKSWFIRKIYKLAQDNRYKEIFQDVLNYIKDKKSFKKEELLQLFKNREEYDLYLSSWGGLLIDLAKKGFICQASFNNNKPNFIHKANLPITYNSQLVNNIEADKKLALNFINSFGPVEVEDFAFWRGIQKRKAQEIFYQVSNNLSEIFVDNKKYYILTADLEMFEKYEFTTKSLILLYRFDPILVSYKDKSSMIDPKFYKRIWQQAGHIEGSIMLDGSIIGSWKYEKKKNQLIFLFNLFYQTNSTNIDLITEKASEIGKFLGYTDFKFVFSDIID